MADIAVLSIPSVMNPKPVNIRSQSGQAGEQVAALGFPAIPLRKAPIAIKIGIIEAEALSYDGHDSSLVVSCDISGGMSGGPVFDRRGEIVGMVMERTFTQTPGDAPDYVERHVVPARYLREVLATVRS